MSDEAAGAATAEPVFDHRDPGTAAAQWQALRERLPAGAAVGGHDHLLVLAAHPDDETLGAGGLIADAAASGAQVTVVVATAGEHSHPDSPTVQASELADARRAEVTRAVEALAPGARLVLLDRPDGGLADDVDSLAAALNDAAGDATVVAAPWRADGHPDHQAAGQAAARTAFALGARLLEYPIWGWQWGVPASTGPLADTDASRGETGAARGDWVRRVMTARARTAKTAAADAHRTQYTPLSDQPGDEAILGPGLLAHFAGTDEIFLEAPATDLPPRYFERLYRQADDPWQLSGSFYETRKRQLLLAALPRARFHRAFEPGCALGLLTGPLVERCDELLAVDASAAAVHATSARVGARPGVAVRVATMPDDWPGGSFDLVVISEIGYYLAEPQLLARRARAALTADGVLVACHWRHPAPGYPSTAEDVHAALGQGLHRLVAHAEPDFLLDVWTREPTSVAREYGILA